MIPSKTNDICGGGRRMLRLENVTLKFGGLVAVNNVSFDMENGGIHALIGPNGAGKTTTFNIVSGVYTPNEGTVTFENQKINGFKPYRINEIGIARTYQNINLFRSMTCLENVLVGQNSRLKSSLLDCILKTPKQRNEEAASRERAYELLRMFGIERHAGNKSSNLSYGEQRLLEIARAMASEPKLLLLDEPAAGMNETEKELLARHIKKLKDMGIHILIVEHDMKLVMGIADTIHVLDFGVMIAEGTPDEVSSNSNVIEAYLGGSE